MLSDEEITNWPEAETATAAPVIRANHLDLTFQTNDGPVHALKDVSLDIAKGSFVSFIGPSGCGKTTFLRCIAALEHPTGGSLTVNGMTPDEARRARAYGYVFQAAGLYLADHRAQHRAAAGDHGLFPGRTGRARGTGAGACGVIRF